jgi:type IV pilus assembly protein PilX
MRHMTFTPLRGACLRRSAPAHKQGGVIMIITLIALAILMIGGVALVRSFDTSMLLSGNLAFKRDLVNQGERGMAQAITLLSSGALASDATRQANALGSNYSATALASDAHGIPVVLFNDNATFTATYTAGDITDAAVTIRYVIDRQCATTGPASVATCITTTRTAADKSGSDFLIRKKAGGGNRPVYRISVRVTGPRNTQAYLQSTLTL